MPAISVLIKPSSSMCNMSCDYCFYCDEAKNRNKDSYGYMTEDTLKNIIRRTMLNAGGLVSYAYQGGEPTLRGLAFFEKAVAFQKQYNRNHIQVQNAFQTNGYLIDEKWCRFLKKNHFLVGLSLDGTRSVHNAMRHTKNGGDTYDRVKAAADMMDEYGVEYNILTVVTAQAAEHITDIYQEYKRNGWGYQQYIACLDPLGEEHGKMDYSLNPESYGYFLVDLFDLWYRDLRKNKQPYIRQFENWIAIAAGYMAESCDQRGVCGIQYVVEADGSVYPCDFFMLDEYCIGNFNTDRLRQIDEKRREIGFLERSIKLGASCSECRYLELCRCGCQRNRDFVPEDGGYHNHLCKGYQIFFEKCGERIMEIADALSGK